METYYLATTGLTVTEIVIAHLDEEYLLSRVEGIPSTVSCTGSTSCSTAALDMSTQWTHNLATYGLILDTEERQ
jgi:hypothetical protein